MSVDLTDSRALARASLAWRFDPYSIAPHTNRKAVQAALDGYRTAMVPMRKLAPGERKDAHAKLADPIRSIGLRIRPDFSDDQARMWITVMIEALGEHPPRVALAAARDAISCPVQFPGEVLGVILEKAEAHFATYRNAMRNLERLLHAIDHPRIEASPEAKAQAALITEHDLQTMPGHMRKLGLTLGLIVEEQGDHLRWATEAEQRERAQAIQAERDIARARSNGKGTG